MTRCDARRPMTATLPISSRSKTCLRLRLAAASRRFQSPESKNIEDVYDSSQFQRSSRSMGRATRMNLDTALLKRLPKVLLHEHLDGVLRPETVVGLARDVGYQGLPSENPEELAQWFHRGANQGSLSKYLEGFAHTIAVMQTEAALERIAYEQAEDLSNDGVSYFETRFAPVFHP